MTREERQALRDAATRALGSSRAESSGRRARPEGWELQTSNSFRRVGMRGDGDVLCAVTHPIDRHPDLSAAPGVLEHVVAAQPRVVLALLDHLDEIETEVVQLRGAVRRLREWRDGVSNAVKTAPEFAAGQWSGDKEGWGYHFEVVRWMVRELERLRFVYEAAKEWRFDLRYHKPQNAPAMAIVAAVDAAIAKETTK